VLVSTSTNSISLTRFSRWRVNCLLQRPKIAASVSSSRLRVSPTTQPNNICKSREASPKGNLTSRAGEEGSGAKMDRKLATLWMAVLLGPLIMVIPVAGQNTDHPQPQVILEDHRDLSPPLRYIEIVPPGKGAPRTIQLFQVPRPFSQGQTDPVVQTAAGPLISTTAGNNFDGVGANGSAPPDTNGAVGATQFVEWVNTEFAVYNKSTGALEYGPVSGNTLWNGFGGPCQTTNDGDPIAQYDKAANRWVMTQLANTSNGPPFYQCFAVSTTSDAMGSYNRYSFTFNDLNDYPKLAVWPDGYYMSFNMFHKNFIFFSFVGAQPCAFDRNAMLNGSLGTVVCFQLSSSFGGLLPSDLDGSTPPPAGSPNYYLNFGSNSLNLWKFHVDFVTTSNSSVSGPTNIPVAAFNEACSGKTCIPQQGTSQQLDSLGDRLMYRLAYRNFGDHESLVVNHSVTAGNSVGVRWYEFRDPGGTPIVYQQGTYAPDSLYRWMGSIAMDSSGDIALGYSVSSSSNYPAIRYTGRVPTDPPNTLEAENSIIEGNGSQTGSLSRWGDYTSMSIDPVDDCTFWYANEYLQSSGSFNWSTRIYSFKFPSCGPTTAPTAPTGLAATPGNTQVSLAWNASSGATSYNVLRSTTSGGSYNSIATGLTTTSYTDTGLTNGTTYYYVVQAANSAGTSANSTQVSAMPVCSTPAPPTGLTATAGNAQVSLSWTASSGASSYNVKRSTSSSGPYTTIASGVTTTSYTDTGLTNGTTYYYVVSAVDACGESANSSQMSATPQAAPAPVAPTGLTASGARRKVGLSWTQSTSPGVTQNKVYRSTTNGGPFSLLVTLSATTSYTDTSVISHTTYYYVVTAVSSSGESSYSNEASATPR
jgi:fibronectin type 3 domain-containing protein